MPDEWFCNECVQRYYPPIGERKGAFGDLFHVLERKNPRAFGLPEEIREYFEGVRTGPDGEYEDSTPVAKPKYVIQFPATLVLALSADTDSPPGPTRKVTRNPLISSE